MGVATTAYHPPVVMRVRWAGYGAPALAALRDAVADAKDGDPLRPVTVIVPANQVGVTARRSLGSGELGSVAGAGPGVAAVTFVTAYRLAELLGSAVLAGQGRRPVSTPVLSAALRRALARAPGVFEAVADHPSTESALVDAYQSLRDLEPDELDRLALGSDRAASVVRLHRAARAQLEPGWYDEQDLAQAAVAALADGPLGAELGPLVVYLPQRLTRHTAGLIAALARGNGGTGVAGTTGDPRADAEIVTSLAWLDADPGAPVAADPYAMVGPDTRIVTASDADEEVRVAVRAVVDAARSGTPLDRIALLWPTPDPYGRLVHEQLAAAGVPCNGAAVEPVTARLAGRVLLGLLGLPDSDFRRDEVFAWLAGGSLRGKRRPLPVTSWERLSRQAGVVAGRDQWDARLSRLAARCLEQASDLAADPDAPPWKIERLRRDAAQASALRAFVLELVDDLAGQHLPGRTWSQRCEWALRRLADLIGPATVRSAWPRAEQRGAERVEQALRRLAALDQVEGPPALDVFVRTLELELQSDLGRIGRIGQGVLVGPLAMAIGLDLDLVVVVGMAEGVLPGRVRDDVLFPDDERATLGGRLPLRREAPHRQHRHLLAALASARSQLLLAPRGDLRRSSDRLPSRWLLAVASRLAGRPLWSDDFADLEAPWIEHLASHDAGIRTCPCPATAQEYRLRALMAGTRREELGWADPELAAGEAVLRARRATTFSRFDGNLAGVHIPSPVDQLTSATRLERWADCPFAYFVGDLLGVDEVENPEDRLRISALDRGSLIHLVLDRFISGVLDRPGGPPPPDQPWTPDDVAELDAIAHSVCAEYEAGGLTGRRLFWGRDRARLVGDLHGLLAFDNDRRAATRSRPVAAELAFGMGDGHQPPAVLPLTDGRRVELRGRADRVDRSDDGTLIVLDYKTGSDRKYQGLDQDHPDGGGTHLQLAVYGLAARALAGDPAAPVEAEYWFLRTKNGGPRRIGYRLTAEVLDRVAETVTTMVRGIEAGVFPNHPAATSTSPWVECAFCDPDGLGVVDLARQVERKRGDAGVARYLALVEADGGDDGD